MLDKSNGLKLVLHLISLRKWKNKVENLTFNCKKILTKFVRIFILCIIVF
jgi:hypothetical protein